MSDDADAPPALDTLCMEIERLRCIAGDVRLLYAAGRFKEYAGEPWLKRAASVDLRRDITGDLRDLAELRTGAAEPVSDERALELAHQICTGKLSAVQGAVEIMQYATDGVLQMQAAAPPVKGDREAIARVICEADAFDYDEEKDLAKRMSAQSAREIIDRAHRYADALIAAGLALHVQPGAGEQDG